MCREEGTGGRSAGLCVARVQGLKERDLGGPRGRPGRERVAQGSRGEPARVEVGRGPIPVPAPAPALREPRAVRRRMRVSSGESRGSGEVEERCGKGLKRIGGEVPSSAERVLGAPVARVRVRVRVRVDQHQGGGEREPARATREGGGQGGEGGARQGQGRVGPHGSPVGSLPGSEREALAAPGEGGGAAGRAAGNEVLPPPPPSPTPARPGPAQPPAPRALSRVDIEPREPEGRPKEPKLRAGEHDLFHVLGAVRVPEARAAPGPRRRRRRREWTARAGPPSPPLAPAGSPRSRARTRLACRPPPPPPLAPPASEEVVPPGPRPDARATRSARTRRRGCGGGEGAALVARARAAPCHPSPRPPLALGAGGPRCGFPSHGRAPGRPPSSAGLLPLPLGPGRAARGSDLTLTPSPAKDGGRRVKRGLFLGMGKVWVCGERTC